MSKFDFEGEAMSAWKADAYSDAERALRRAYAAGHAEGKAEAYAVASEVVPMQSTDLDRLVTLAAGIEASARNGARGSWTVKRASQLLSALKAKVCMARVAWGQDSHDEQPYPRDSESMEAYDCASAIRAQPKENADGR